MSSLIGDIMNTRQMSVEEIRKLLVENGLSEQEAQDIKGKAALVEKLRELGNFVMEEDEDFDNTLFKGDNVEVHDDVLDTQQVEENLPSSQDKEWTEYVISLMYPDEVRDGHPTVDGLRRITEKIHGQIFAVQTKVYQTPAPENQFSASVRVRITLDNGRQFDGSADVCGRNTESKFANHPLATAESRAEARAYRRLLRLRNIISAEETVNEEAVSDPFDTIQENQLVMLDKTAKTLNLNMEAWLALQNIKLIDLMSTKRTEAALLCAEINSLRTKGVSEELLGYKNWR